VEEETAIGRMGFIGRGGRVGDAALLAGRSHASELAAEFEAGADLEDGAHDGESDEADEGEHAAEHHTGDHFGEKVELGGDDLLVGGGDLLEAGDDVAGVFADGQAVEDEVGKQPVRVRATERASPSRTRAVAVLKAVRCTSLPICFSVMRRASEAVIPFSRRTESVWLNEKTVCGDDERAR